MKKIVSLVSVIPVFLSCIIIITGCAQGNCRENRGLHIVEEKAMASNSSQMEKTKVFKYDGSLQCGMGKSISPEEMKNEFGKIEVFSFENKPDGLMHTQVCGSPTGKANVYEILKKDLPEAKKLGFKEWLW